MAKMAIAACLIGAIVLVWGRKEIVNEKSAKNEKVIATQTIEIQENERLHLSVGADVGQTIFWSPSLKGKAPYLYRPPIVRFLGLTFWGHINLRGF